MSHELQLESGAEDGTPLVTARGEIDMQSSPRLLAELRRLERERRVVLDLSGVSYIDSSGIAVLIQGLKAARRNGQQFVLRRPSAKVMAVLELADLTSLFEIEQGQTAS